MITLEDMQGFMEVCRDVPGPSLDIVLHSPGGIPEATASIVRYLREKYSDIRVFVPLAAMSAATMLALAANRIVMGKHSQLGPIDPQLQAGTWAAPARGILEQFERAKQECKTDPAALAAWAPILQQSSGEAHREPPFSHLRQGASSSADHAPDADDARAHTSQWPAWPKPYSSWDLRNLSTDDRRITARANTCPSGSECLGFATWSEFQNASASDYGSSRNGLP